MSTDAKKEHARLLFMRGEQQRIIAEKVGVTEKTVGLWVSKNGWREQRAATNITRPELVSKILRTVDRLVEQLNASEDPAVIASAGDKLAKFAAAIKGLEKKASVVDVVEVFMDFGRWLHDRAASDGGLTSEIIRTVNHYQDIYVAEQLNCK